VPAAPIHSVTDLAQDAHVRAHNMLIEIEHPAGRVEMVGNPIKLSRVAETYQAPPALGQHTSEVLERVLGLSDRDVTELREAGIV
jgi:crotonobetainyl-CoA:carnitine CoA-transferase CaiB-like acyl-CoA transferase